ncbi:protein translocase subunit SecD [Iamia sp. SCSIO 61187]|uniref:protein translocase subunit SecD n=1 Tax=Iamia sp. SCSIO 61187 TaxID=2722752 RepID=UPI001C626819|nr:protein translocase subunit SecD [Iamia sp. SCSIO 61187]QYG93393.1 protein translocase subunit SecD [Iamia sp. SCSIO 61187]
MSDGRDDDPIDGATDPDAAGDATEGDPTGDDAAADEATEDDGTDGDATESDEDDGDDAAAAPSTPAAETPKKSGPPPRPSKARAAKKAAPPRPKAGAKGSRRARRRRYEAEAVLALVVALLVARIVTLAIDDTSPSGWAWASLVVVVGAVLLAARTVLERRGKLTGLRNRGLGALASVLALAVFSLTMVVVTGSEPQLGLDLQGGFSVVLSAQGNPADDSIDQAMEIIRNRIDGLGVAEPEVTRQGDNVVVDLPGIEDRERAQEILGETAKLQFRPVLAENLPYDAEAAAAGDDPCAAGVAGAAGAPTDSVPAEDPATSTEPGATTVPGDTATTAPGATEPAPTESTEAPPTSEEGAAGPAPAGAAPAVDGEYAAPPLARQETTTTTAPADETTTTAPTDETTTTAPAEETTTTTAPVDPSAEAAAAVAFPSRPDPDAEPISCTQVGPESIDGEALSKSQAELSPDGQGWIVSVAIKGSRRDEANALMNGCSSVAASCPTGLMAIVLDEEVISAPQVRDPNLADDDFVISGGGDGGFAESEAKDLALKLRYGALPVEFTRSAERQVSPTLGEDSLRAGLLAGLIGLAAVALYLIVYYRGLGVVVVLGLGVWSALMYGTVCWLSATRGLTLSLSGVVGIVVSVGTTVDSYVVHFERLKDEVRLGKSVRSSTEKGFQKAFKTILTADLASLMGAALLWYLTVGAVRGFAFFLGLSVVLDLLVAYCFDRPMVALLARSRFFTEHPIFGVARGLGRSGDEGGGARRTPRAQAGATS